jgi:hypothetical protein
VIEPDGISRRIDGNAEALQRFRAEVEAEIRDVRMLRKSYWDAFYNQHMTPPTYMMVHNSPKPEPLPYGMPWAIFGLVSILSILGVLILGGII